MARHINVFKCSDESELNIETLHNHLKLTGRDLRGIDQNEIEILTFLRDEANGPAGMNKIAEVLGLDKKFVSEKLRNLRREGLVQNMGTSGHSITNQGRLYLSDNGY